MVESISKIQQLLAESKFVEAQKAAELVLIQQKSSESAELLDFYFQSLIGQSKPLPEDYVLLLVEKLLPSNPDAATEWLLHLRTDKKNEQQRLVYEIRIAEAKGRTEELYRLISQYQILKFESGVPNVTDTIQGFIKKYFLHDFHIQLQKLAIDLMRLDLSSSEATIKELVLSCFERSSPRGTKEKLNSLCEVLKSQDSKNYLEMYQNFCSLMSHGVTSKKDFKKIIELVIHIDEFKFQALVLNLLVKENLNEAATDYSAVIKKHPDYSFVYFDKFFPHLKKFFHRPIPVLTKVIPQETQVMDLKVTPIKTTSAMDEAYSEFSEEDDLLGQLLKHQTFTSSELLDIAVSFIQSDFNHAGLKASQLAYNLSSSDEERLRACYLKITCLLKTGDYRAALDVSLTALDIAQTQNDILSFLYSQAEAHLRLSEYKAAKFILKKILSIDAGYRLAKERLERLNAI